MFERLTETEWAYIAGIIDGEGCLGVYARARKHKGTRQVTASPSYRPRLQVVNTNLGLLLWIRDRIGGDIKSHVLGGRCKVKHTWRNGSARAIQEICKACLPYLVIKKRQAETVLKFPIDVVCNQWTIEETERFRTEKRGLYEETLKLNRRGQLVQ